MRKIQKAFVAGCILTIAFLCFATIILFSTYTYCGTVTELTESRDGCTLTLRDGDTGEERIIRASYIHTDLRYCHLERDIYWGDFMNLKEPVVEIRCQRFFNPYKSADSVVVQFDHDS